MRNLKPCPFCGGEAYFRDDTSHRTAYFVGCSDENCFGYIHWGETEAEAVSAWNLRATPPEVTAMVEALWFIANEALDMVSAQYCARDALAKLEAAQ